MKTRFLELAEENEDFPIGAGNWLRLHPEDRVKSEYDAWTFGPNIRRMPEFAAPGVGRQSRPASPSTPSSTRARTASSTRSAARAAG